MILLLSYAKECKTSYEGTQNFLNIIFSNHDSLVFPYQRKEMFRLIISAFAYDIHK